MPGETVLSIDKISKRYGRIQAVDRLSVEVRKGQVFGILGPNGSGKTTTLSIVLDLVSADSGSFRWFGEDPTHESRKRIGAVIESPNFFPYLSATRNLELTAAIREHSADDIPRVLKLTGLYERRNSRFRTFSFGMKQRLAVASALLGHPEVLILDEPTNGLDPQGIVQIREIIHSVAAEGITIILASHLLDEVQKICTRVAVLNKGQILFSGAVDEVLAVSDCMELNSADIAELENALTGHTKFKSSLRADGILLAYFNGQIAPGEINEFLHQKGIILTHLAERKRTLEKHFLELLNENK
jgi:ABC-2 type transport system ATP-binding protein